MKSSQIVKLALLQMAVLGGVETAFADVVYSYTTIDVPGATKGTSPSGINSSGQIVGSFTPSACPFPCRGFLYADGIFTAIDNPSSINGTFVNGINDSGQIVGSLVTQISFLYTGGSFTNFAVPGTMQTTALGINDSGQIVGTFTYDQDLVKPAHSFLYEGGSFTMIEYPGANVAATNARAINNRGQIVGSFRDGTGTEIHIHGFLDSGGLFTTIDFPGGTRSVLQGINDQGEIVGISMDDTGGTLHSFLDNGGLFTPIDFPGATRTVVQGINDSGQIVGFFVDGTETHGFLATPVATVPEPLTSPVLAGCLIGLFAMACRRERAHKVYSQ